MLQALHHLITNESYNLRLVAGELHFIKLICMVGVFVLELLFQIN